MYQLEKIKFIQLIHARTIHHSSAACSAARGSAGVHAATSQAACRIQRALTASRSARLLHEQTNAHTGALHLHGRHTRAGLLRSCSGRLTPTCSPLDGRRAASRRRIPLLAASPPRCCQRRLRRCSCRRGRRSCRAPQLDAYHCCCHQQGTCESRTGDSKRALGVGRRADADRERATRSARGGLRAR